MIRLKKTYLLFFLSLINLYAFNQTSIPYIFYKRDDVSLNTPDVGKRCYYWNNGILVMGGCVNNNNTKQGVTLVFYDTVGTMLWSKIYYLPDYKNIYGEDIVFFNDSNFYLCGTVCKDVTIDYDGFFSKFNSNGDSLFFNVYKNGSENGYLLDMEQNQVSTILLLYLVDTDYYGLYGKIRIDKIDTAGYILNSSETGYGLKYPDQIITGNNKIFVGGTKRTTADDNYQCKVFINVYDTNLTFLTTWNPSLTYNEWFASLNIVGNSLYLTSCITVQFPPSMNSFQRTRIGQINSIGSYINYKNIGPYNFTIGNYPTYLLNDSIFIIPVSNYYNNLYFVDTSLNFICSSPYLNLIDGNNQLFDITILPDNKIAGTGDFYTANQNETEDHWSFLTGNMLEYIDFLSTNQVSCFWVDYPTAAFSYSIHNSTVTFTNQSTYADTCVWLFGDGSTLITACSDTVTHTYNQNGNFKVELEAWNCCQVLTGFEWYHSETIYVWNDIEENNANLKKIILNPNPVEHSLFIQISTSEQNNFSESSDANVRLLNLFGTVFLNAPLSKDKTEIDISKIPVGIYIVEIVSGSTVIAREKIVKL